MSQTISTEMEIQELIEFAQNKTRVEQYLRTLSTPNNHQKQFIQITLQAKKDDSLFGLPNEIEFINCIYCDQPTTRIRHQVDGVEFKENYCTNCEHHYNRSEAMKKWHQQHKEKQITRKIIIHTKNEQERRKMCNQIEKEQMKGTIPCLKQP